MEKQYVDDLSFIIQGFMQPFRKNMADNKQNAIIKSNEMASIFANIEHIHNVLFSRHFLFCRYMLRIAQILRHSRRSGHSSMESRGSS